MTYTYEKETLWNPAELIYYFDENERKAAEIINQIITKLEIDCGIKFKTMKDLKDLIDCIECGEY